MSARAEGLEPFPITADPESYVQTAATEEALEALQRKVRERRAPVVLVGTPGVGKTLLLRVLEQRLAGSFHVVYLPLAVLPADELCTWVLELLGESAGRDPERDLLAASLRLEGAGLPLVVMLDDAGSMPVATARRLSALLARAEGAIRLVLALPEDSRSGQMLASFQPGASRVELRALMSAEETARYLRAHLVRSNAPPEVRARFDPTSTRYLHRGSGGVPRVLSGLAGELARGNLAVLPLHEMTERDQPLGFAADPFEVTSDPAAYVPRRATQELLESVEGALRSGACAIAVTGPPGLGKTMLLRVLERRLRGRFRGVRISYAALLPDEFCRWILTLLGEPVAEDPELALGVLACRLADSRTNLVLLLDDAGAMPIPTVRHLVGLAGETNGAMRLVLFSAQDARTAGLLGALGSDAVTLRLSEPMSEDETAEYIRARLAHARAPTALVERFDSETVARLHVESEGIPRELHKLASEIYREGEGAVATRAPPPDLREARSEPQAPPAPPAPSRVEAEEPARQPIPARAAISGRLVAFGLLLIAIPLAVILLLRGGFPWNPATRGANPGVAPPAVVQPPETRALPASQGSAEPIAVNINATPWASVEVDGEYLGVTPLAGVPLSPGSHVFRARMPDGEIRIDRVEVGPTMRDVVFYADLLEEVEPEPEMAAAPAPPPPVPEELPEIAVEATQHLERALPEIPLAPDEVAPLREPEPAPPPPVPEPEIASPAAPPLVEEPPAIAVEPSPPTQEPLPETAAEALVSPQEETPEIAVAPEQVASARAPEPAPPPHPPEPISVSINATPWATIEIDGEEIGITPMAGVLLAPGDRQFRVIMPDGTVLERLVRIAPDNRHIAFAP